MITYRDRTFCASEVEKHTCGRELTEEDKKRAEEIGLPIAYGKFCEITSKEMRVTLKENMGNAKKGEVFVQGLYGVPDYYKDTEDTPEDWYWAETSKREDNRFLPASCFREQKIDSTSAPSAFTIEN